MKTTGAKIEDFAPARANLGPSVDIRVRKQPGAASTFKVQGELLTAYENGIIILYTPSDATGIRATRVPYDLMRKCFFEDLQYLTLGEGRVLTESIKDNILLVSRYPGGIESASFQKFLENLGQSEIDFIENRP